MNVNFRSMIVSYDHCVHIVKFNIYHVYIIYWIPFSYKPVFTDMYINSLAPLFYKLVFNGEFYPKFISDGRRLGANGAKDEIGNNGRHGGRALVAVLWIFGEFLIMMRID
jgi:hypothetical protein